MEQQKNTEEFVYEENKEYQRQMPMNDLDLNLMLTDSVWGKPEVAQELRNKLSEYFKQVKADGKVSISKESKWGLLAFYTRDMRLSNLSSWDNELQTCRYMIDLAGDLLNSDMTEPFIIALSRAATILETSQSKGGFLRKMMNTLRQFHYNQNIEPPKKQMFGGSKKRENGRYRGDY